MNTFNISFGRTAPGAPDPGFDVPYGEGAPRIQARGNLSYLDYIDLIEYLWEKGNPEIKFVPMASKKEAYDPDKGYIVYQLDSRVPKESNPKPRYQETYPHPDDPKSKISVYSQSFINIIRFVAVHQNPRTAEEMIEAFEDFMMEVQAICKALGIEEILYARRVSDDMEKRFGTDLCTRSILYSVTVQKTFPVEQNKLESVIVEIRKRVPKYNGRIWRYAEKITEDGVVSKFEGYEES